MAKGATPPVPKPTVSGGPQPRLTPELLARLERMAHDSGRTIEQELEAIVRVAWVGYATRNGW